MSNHPIRYEDRETNGGRTFHRAICGCDWASLWVRLMDLASDAADAHRDEMRAAGLLEVSA